MMMNCSRIRTPRPAKNFLFRVLSEELVNVGDVESVCDIGSAECAFYPYFRCKYYYAFDIDVERPKSSLDTFNHHTITHEAYPIDITNNPTFRQGTLVFCIQVMIGNLSFDMNSISQSIENLVSSTEPAGSLIFNLKTSNSTIRDIKDIVSPYFRSIKIVRYGLWNFRIKYPLSTCLGFMLYIAYKLGMPLPGNRYLFVCSNKVSR